MLMFRYDPYFWCKAPPVVMAQIFDPLPFNSSDQILCCYVNATSKIQVVRVTNIANWYFERVVFPGQRLVFESLPQAYLEIHTGMMASAILSDRIPCDRLQVEEESDEEPALAESEAIDNSTIEEPLAKVTC
jgi:hypothetical protein